MTLVIGDITAASGAVVMGRRTFDTVDGAWSAERGYGADRGGRPPFFVVTGRAPESYRLADSHDFTFVLDGPAAAIGLARAAAGSRDVFVMGGGTLIGSCLRDGLLEELRLHLSPELLGAGTPLFAGGRPAPPAPDRGGSITGLYAPDLSDRQGLKRHPESSPPLVRN